MGVGMFVMFDPELPVESAFNSGTDGKSTTALLPLLDEIAQTKGLPAFSRFVPDTEDFDWEGSDPDDLPELLFDPSEGLKEVAVLLASLRSERSWADWPPEWVDDVVACLGLLSKDLEAAKQAGSQFSLHFA